MKKNEAANVELIGSERRTISVGSLWLRQAEDRLTESGRNKDRAAK